MCFCILECAILFYLQFTNSEQEKLDTGIDQGGPSRQFISDTCLQLQTLTVPVGRSGAVEMFYQGTRPRGDTSENVWELIPQTDEWMIDKMKDIIYKENAGIEKTEPEVIALFEVAQTRVKLYCRAIGRILVRIALCHP
jgi:hypothetical protein